MRFIKKGGWLTSAVILLVVGVPTATAHNFPGRRPPADGSSPARCGSLDTPETGLQGDVPLVDQQSTRAEQGYNCGLAVVGEAATQSH